MRRTILTLLSFAALSVPAMAQTAVPRAPQPQAAPPSKIMPGGDAGPFVTKATMGNGLEIESSRLALEKAKAQDVREFAQTMIADHTKAAQELEAILRESNATAPTNKMDASHQQQIDRLKNADEAKFDREYMQLQTKAHEDAIALFRQYAQSGSDAKLRAFAQKTLPELERHAGMVRKLSVH